jgi:dienelactone hydrolase
MDREAILREIAKKRVAYRLPGMDALPARRTLAYRSASGSQLALHVYHPVSEPGARAPVVVVPLGYPDLQGGVADFGPIASWAELIAASGMAAVLYGTEAPERDVHTVLDHLRSSADRMPGLDAGRLGLFATSGSVPVALSALMHDRRVTCAALLYGYTMDLDGSTAVADMSRQAGFVDACAGKSVHDLPQDLPTLFVRAGRDQFPGLNDALDKVIAGALARNLPITVVNHASGAHGFDVDEDTDTTRRIVQQVLTFLRRYLGA